MVSLLFGKISIVLLLNILVQTESAEIITELTPKFGGSFETPWFCNYTDVSKEMEKLCNLTFELKWTYNGLSSVLNVEFVDSTSPEARLSIGTTKYVAGLIYPHYDNLWYFTPSTRQFNDSATFFWSDVAESEGDLSVTSNLTHFNLKKLASYESLVCSRIGILIFNQRSVDKWTLVYRASSYQLSQFDCPLLDLQVPEAEIFFTPNLAKSRRGLSKRDTDIDRQADMIDFQPLEDSIRVSLDVVKNKTTGGLAWLRNKLHQAKTGYDKFQKETKLNEKIQNSWNNLLEKIKIQRRRRRSADEQFNWRSQLKNFLRFSPFHKSQEDDGHILSDLGLKQPVAIPQISDVIPSTTTQETTTTTTTEPTTTETTTTTTTESTTTTTTTTESTTESTTTTTTTESTTTTTTTEPTTTTTTEETTTTTPITTTENVVVETTVVTTVEPVSSTSKIVELDEQSSVVNAEEDDEIEAKSEPLIGGEEESTTTTTTTTESTTTIELTTTTESTTTTTTTEESTTTTTTTTTEETTTTTEPTTTTTTTTEEPTTTTVEIEFEKTLVESTVEKMEKLAEIERVEEIPSTTTEETTTTTTSTTESTTTTAEIESTTTTEMTTTTSFEEDDETTTPIIIETTSTTTESTTTTTTTEPTTTTTTESTTTTTIESITATTTTEPTTTETTTESTTTTEPSTTTVTSNETSSSDTKIIVLPDNIRMEVTNYTVIDESTGNKTYSLRLHLKGYKWNEGFQNVNSSESQQFMKEKILPLLLKFLNVSQDQLDDVKLLKLSKAAAAAGKGLISRRSIFRRGASAGNDDRFDMDVQFLMRLHH